jgi:hypothetical protein
MGRMGTAHHLLESQFAIRWGIPTLLTTHQRVGMGRVGTAHHLLESQFVIRWGIPTLLITVFLYTGKKLNQSLCINLLMQYRFCQCPVASATTLSLLQS